MNIKNTALLFTSKMPEKNKMFNKANKMLIKLSVKKLWIRDKSLTFANSSVR